jgi:hypothetical protein
MSGCQHKNLGVLNIPPVLTIQPTVADSLPMPYLWLEHVSRVATYDSLGLGHHLYFAAVLQPQLLECSTDTGA